MKMQEIKKRASVGIEPTRDAINALLNGFEVRGSHQVSIQARVV